MGATSRTTLLAALALGAAMLPAVAETAAPAPWALTPDTGYGYTRDGKLVTFKMGTTNAKELFKGAKKVPKETLFFVGANGQLYERHGAFQEGDGSFKFGPDR